MNARRWARWQLKAKRLKSPRSQAAGAVSAWKLRRLFRPSQPTPTVRLAIWLFRSAAALLARFSGARSEEHTSELQSLMRISYAVFCLKKKKTQRIDKQWMKTVENEIVNSNKLKTIR